MLTAYMDESGIHGDDWCVVAGFLGTDEQWGHLADEWKIALGKRKALHAKELRWGGKAYRSRKLLERLGPLPRECGLERVFGLVRLADYQDLVPVGKHVNNAASPYMIACQHCMRAVLESIPAPERIKFVLERQTKYSPYKSLPDWFFSLLYPGRLEIQYLPKESTSLFQPADYLAFALRCMKINPQSEKAQLTKSIVLSGNDGKSGVMRGYGEELSRDRVRNAIKKAAGAYERILGKEKN
jgi:hypothetical protein